MRRRRTTDQGRPMALDTPHHAADPQAADAITLLISDHDEVQELFDTYDQLAGDEESDAEKAALAAHLCGLLTVHMTIEEEIFYPAVRAGLEQPEMIDEAEVEHAAAKDLIAQILAMEPSDDLFDAKVKVLGEQVAHHVEEEEDELFPAVQESRLDLDTLGERLAERKEELMAQLETAPDA
jgi:iron-sulfur cluster repair protein YtfE (RIC family)